MDGWMDGWMEIKPIHGAGDDSEVKIKAALLEDLSLVSRIYMVTHDHL